MKPRTIAFGALFGFLLSRAGATDYDAIYGMFRLTDLHLYGVIGAAVAVTAAGFWLFRRFALDTRSGAPAAIVPKPYTAGAIWGGLLFGAGWALAGACPGTAIAQIGEGRIGGIAVFAGIVAGALLWSGHADATYRRSRGELYRAGRHAPVDCRPAG